MNVEKIRHRTPTIRKIHYSKLLLFNKFSFNYNVQKNQYIPSKSTSKKVYFRPKNALSEMNKKLLKQKDKKVQELQQKLEKEKDERYKCQVKYLCLQQAYEQQKLIEEQTKNKNFLEKSEICDYWLQFAGNDINNFIDFEDEPYILYYLISELFILCSELIKEFLSQKYSKLLLSLNLPSTENSLEQISKTLKPFILENMSAIVFNDQENDIFLENFKITYKENYIKNINEKIDEFEDIINDNSFKKMLNNVKNLTLFALFNEPILYFDIVKNVNERKIEIIKVKNDTEKYIIVNSDGTNEFEGIILLNPPITKSGNTIAILSDLKKVILKCSKEQINKLKQKELTNKDDINLFIDKRNSIRKIQEEFNYNNEKCLIFKTTFNSHPCLNLYNSKTQILNENTYHTSNEDTNFFNNNFGNYYLTEYENENKKENKIKDNQKENENIKNKINTKNIGKNPITKNQINSLISINNKKLLKIYKCEVKKKQNKYEKKNKELIPEKILMLMRPKNLNKNCKKTNSNELKRNSNNSSNNININMNNNNICSTQRTGNSK
jgi:hypothetical protein